jgi:hypothetical protein
LALFATKLFIEGKNGMRKFLIASLMFSVSLVINVAAANANGTQHSMCDAADKSNFYVLDVGSLVRNDMGISGEINATEVSILARGKKVCFMGVKTGLRERGDSTIAVFEKGRVSCNQTSDAARLMAARLRRTGYKVVGEFAGVLGKTINLNNCGVESL